MKILRTPREMQALCADWRATGTVGFVATMGALHDGHLALCRRARGENARFAASIFVNPAQFGPREDLSRYPRPFERDCDLLRAAGCDALFVPDAETMYPPGGAQMGVEVPALSACWEGAARPGHFRGVATVVAKLLNITRPSRAYFGEKDWQQLAVITHMNRELFFDTQVVPCETAREADGLARSSRNAYLSPDERRAAPVLWRALQEAARLAGAGERDGAVLEQAMRQICAAKPLIAPDYLAVVDAQTLEPLARLDGRAARLLVAARIGSTRLIDNAAL